MKMTLLSRLPALAAVSFLLAPITRAQDLPNLVDVAIVIVKSGMTAEFEAVQKDMVAEMKRSKIKGRRLVYTTVRGNTSEYHIVTPIEKYADLDNPDQVGDAAWNANWLARVTKFVQSRETVVAEVMKDLSNPWKGESALGLMIRITVADGKADQFDETVRSEWMPLRKKLGVRGPVVYRPRYGERSRRGRLLTFPMDNWASVDEPNQFLAKGGDEARAALDRFLENVADSTWIVTRYRADLSYVP